MSAPNDFRFTSSNKEKVALLINRKHGENYHMRPVRTRHTGFSSSSLQLCAREKSTYRGGYRARHRDTMFERETNCHPSTVIVGGREGEKDVSRVCAVGT